MAIVYAWHMCALRNSLETNMGMETRTWNQVANLVTEFKSYTGTILGQEVSATPPEQLSVYMITSSQLH